MSDDIKPKCLSASTLDSYPEIFSPRPVICRSFTVLLKTMLTNCRKTMNTGLFSMNFG